MSSDNWWEDDEFMAPDAADDAYESGDEVQDNSDDPTYRQAQRAESPDDSYEVAVNNATLDDYEKLRLLADAREAAEQKAREERGRATTIKDVRDFQGTEAEFMEWMNERGRRPLA